MAVNAAEKEALAAQAAGKAPDDLFQPDHPARGVTRIVDHDRAILEMLEPDGQTPRKKIALVGFAGATRDMAPFADPEWVIVGMNQLSRHIPRADVWFEIHKEWNTAVVPGTDHAGWLAACDMPVLMAERVEGIPTSVRFPIERGIEGFNDYFTSTVAYMLAWAMDHIDRAVNARLADSPPATPLDAIALARSLYAEWQVGIYGIDLVVGEEYTQQRPCAEYLLGHLLARNVTVMIPRQSALLKQRYRYGYQMEPEDLVRDSDLRKRRAHLTEQHQAHTQACIEITGALKENDWYMQLRELRERGADVQI